MLLTICPLPQHQRPEFPPSGENTTKNNHTMYVVFESGGIEFDPKFHGMFSNLGLAKECIKVVILKFLKDFMLPHEDLEKSGVIVEKQKHENYTYFYTYQDQQEQEYGAYMNVFVLAEVNINKGP